MSRSSTSLSWRSGCFFGPLEQTTEIPQLQSIDDVFDVSLAQVQPIPGAVCEKTAAIPVLQLVLFPGQGRSQLVVVQRQCRLVQTSENCARLSNKSAGVLNALRKPFTSEHICQTWTPPPSLQGRALAARLKGGFFDLFVCCMHLLPRPQAASKRGGYQRTVERLSEWLDGCLSEQNPLFFRMPMMESVWRSVLADIVLSTVSALRLQGTSRTRGGQAFKRDYGETPHEGHLG